MAGYVLSGPPRGSGPVERAGEKAGGVMMEAQGALLSIELFGDSDGGAAAPTVGLDARLQNVAAEDAGASRRRCDARLQLGFRTPSRR
jgi:hypothetical protein